MAGVLVAVELGVGEPRVLDGVGECGEGELSSATR